MPAHNNNSVWYIDFLIGNNNNIGISCPACVRQTGKDYIMLSEYYHHRRRLWENSGLDPCVLSAPPVFDGPIEIR